MFLLSFLNFNKGHRGFFVNWASLHTEFPYGKLSECFIIISKTLTKKVGQDVLSNECIKIAKEGNIVRVREYGMGFL